MSGIYIPDVSLPGEGDFELWIAVRKGGSFTYNVRGGWQDGKQKAVPVADVRPVVHATWETDTCHFYCSECEHYVDYKTNFCPNCGAKMEES